MRIFRTTIVCALSLSGWLSYIVLPLLLPPVQAQTLAKYEELILPGPMVTRPDVQAFISTMAARHGFGKQQLESWFGSVRVRDDIIAKITRPAEKTKTWYDYRNIFLDDDRIENGAAFCRDNRTWLVRAEQQYGVPAQIIIAILGVETRYGRITGKDRVLEALATLAFAYPPRADFFRKELEQYLLLTREEGIDPLSLYGSYAGAMGLAQFMPSSYRSYAVDFDGDGHRDLWHNPADAIGSIANYLSRHHWQRSAPVTIPARIQGQTYRQLLGGNLKPRWDITQLKNYGIFPTAAVDATRKAILLELEDYSGPEYWLGFDNFYVITRYNNSPLYAMAVYHLSWEIRRLYGA
jgi:membrane-bound lytic murein transglycosylase B